MFRAGSHCSPKKPPKSAGCAGTMPTLAYLIGGRIITLSQSILKSRCHVCLLDRTHHQCQSSHYCSAWTHRHDCNNCTMEIISYGPLKAFQGSNNLVAQILRESRMLDFNEEALISADILELERRQSFYDTQLQGNQLHQRAVIEALERRRSLYDAQLQDIQSHQCAVMKALDARRSFRAPIRRLPRDLLIEIFHFVRRSWWQDVDDDRHWSPIIPDQSSLRLDGPLWVLGRVCGLWRETLHTSPASWSQNAVLRTPFPKHPREILQAYLERTGDHPITVQVVSDTESYPKVEEDEIMSFFVQESCHRWKDAIIATGMHRMHLLEESISRLPILQTIQIHIANRILEIFRSNICLMAPQLWQATVSSPGLSQMRLPPSITHYSGVSLLRTIYSSLVNYPGSEYGASRRHPHRLCGPRYRWSCRISSTSLLGR
ncbi:hypothetical protein ARMSODRAFT_678063 [Armillaria solidipes]|uniref:F-box domain-containing protein n=1 Tax=Armillaria solidipes TaxID=1076256 RepID=A0A2H3AQG0_9AGAR|nr:hypothetical protein ARMSODRAFT_678063 [Armillaria solidipes]